MPVVRIDAANRGASARGHMAAVGNAPFGDLVRLRSLSAVRFRRRRAELLGTTSTAPCVIPEVWFEVNYDELSCRSHRARRSIPTALDSGPIAHMMRAIG